MTGLFNTPALQLLEKGLGTATLRHQVIADNLANIDTPGYKRKEVAFEAELQRVLQKGPGLKGMTTHPKHIPIGCAFPEEVVPQIHTQAEQEYRNDKNNVDIDREMAILAKNTLMYETLLAQLSNRLAKIKNTIREVR
ncbi:MAG: flagellar basal body rod protein FlgB [Heliobacteriaceae bacterium]|nr:flagellar basal body rod protein FlgB [Heliobacteriaceae bacterium]MDD4587064.1 flagellar basal body rod protein FlgB [Heliobacteriaceae bacterium]